MMTIDLGQIIGYPHEGLIIVDYSVFEKSLNTMAQFLQLKEKDDIRLLLPVIMAKIDDYRVDAGIMDVLGNITPTKHYKTIDCETLMVAVEDSSEAIQHILNNKFNLPRETYYSFEDWLGNDVRIEAHYEY